MSRRINAAALVGLMTFAASAPAWSASPVPGNDAAPLTQKTAPTPQWLSSSESGLSLGPNGFSNVTRNETSAKLGEGLNAGFFSNQYTTPGAMGATAAPAALDPMGRWSTPLPALNTGAAIGPVGGLNTGLYPRAGQSFSTFGGQVTQDLGGGLSVNFVGGVTRDPAGGYALGPHGSLNMMSGGQTSATAGAGMTMDLGGGSSFSLSGTVSKTNGSAFGRCAGLTSAFCR